MRRIYRISIFLGFIFAFVSTSGLAEGIKWKKVGKPNGASKIAACNDGRLYALNFDGGIWVNSSGGIDSGWKMIGTASDAQSILCASNKLFTFTKNRAVWRNDGSDHATKWKWIGSPTGARELAAGTLLALLVPTPRFVALNDDNTLWLSQTGGNGSWKKMGFPGEAHKIAVGGGLNEVRIFALNKNRRLYVNRGSGCDEYWRYIDYPGSAREIAAKNMDTIYALNDDQTLWEGTVVRSTRMMTLDNDQLQTILQLLSFNETRLQMHKNKGSFTPSGALGALGVPSREFEIPTKKIGNDFYSLSVWINNVSTQQLGLAIQSGKIRMSVAFEESGDEIYVESPSPNFDIEDFRANADLGITLGACGRNQFKPENIQFHGELDANGPLGELLDWVLGKVVDFRKEVQNELGSQLKKLFADQSTQRAIERIFVQYASTATGENWIGVVGTSVTLNGNQLSYTVER